jgi:hypothetical protein
MMEDPFIESFFEKEDIFESNNGFLYMVVT